LAVLAAVFTLQVLLGGATVELGNSPVSVVLHWGMAMALLGTLTVLATLAFWPATGLRGAARGIGSDAAAAALASAGGFVFLAMCAGAYVSSSHAGLACPGFPLCGAGVLGSGEAQFAQMLHRAAALVVVLAALVAAGIAASSPSPRVRLSAFTACGLVFVQAGLGAANVYAGMPTALRELHAANACLTFLAFVLAATFATLERAPLRAEAKHSGLRPARIAASR
jgi:heme A synthase